MARPRMTLKDFARKEEYRELLGLLDEKGRDLSELRYLLTKHPPRRGKYANKRPIGRFDLSKASLWKMLDRLRKAGIVHKRNGKYESSQGLEHELSRLVHLHLLEQMNNRRVWDTPVPGIVTYGIDVDGISDKDRLELQGLLDRIHYLARRVWKYKFFEDPEAARTFVKVRNLDREYLRLLDVAIERAGIYQLPDSEPPELITKKLEPIVNKRKIRKLNEQVEDLLRTGPLTELVGLSIVLTPYLDWRPPLRSLLGDSGGRADELDIGYGAFQLQKSFLWVKDHDDEEESALKDLEMTARRSLKALKGG